MKLNGYYFEIIDYDNGFNGCVDASKFYNGFLAKDAAQVRGLYKQIIVLLQLQYAQMRTVRT